jgi:hypothetical protein
MNCTAVGKCSTPTFSTCCPATSSERQANQRASSRAADSGESLPFHSRHSPELRIDNNRSRICIMRSEQKSSTVRGLIAAAAAFDRVGAMSLDELTAVFGEPDVQYRVLGTPWSIWDDLEVLTIDGAVFSQLLESAEHVPRSRALRSAQFSWLDEIESADDLLATARASLLPFAIGTEIGSEDSLRINFHSGFSVWIDDGVVVCSWRSPEASRS